MQPQQAQMSTSTAPGAARFRLHTVVANAVRVKKASAWASSKQGPRPATLRNAVSQLLFEVYFSTVLKATRPSECDDVRTRSAEGRASASFGEGARAVDAESGGQEHRGDKVGCGCEWLVGLQWANRSDNEQHPRCRKHSTSQGRPVDRDGLQSGAARPYHREPTSSADVTKYTG